MKRKKNQFETIPDCMPMHVAPYVTRAKEFNNQKLSFPANSSHRFSHGHSLDVFLLWQYVFLLHSHLLESKLLTDILPASCQLCWDGACDDSSREETGKSSRYHTPRHHRNLVGEQQDEAFLASCIIYYTEKSSLINTFTCLFYYLWLVDFHTPWIQPCFFCHVIVSRRTRVWTPTSAV